MKIFKTTVIDFQKDVSGRAVFRFHNKADYIAAIIFGAPLAAAYCWFLVFILLHVESPEILRYTLYIVIGFAVFLTVMVVTNASQAPILNPQRMFTSVRTLIVRPDGKTIFRMGLFPLCLQRTILKANIEKIVIEKQKRPRGMAFFEYFLDPINFYSLYFETSSGKRHSLAINETRNGYLADAGSALAEFIDVPFEQKGSEDESK